MVKNSDKPTATPSGRFRTASGSNPHLVVGWRELVTLPEWGVIDLKAKIDTGARTSALHVEKVKLLAGNRVKFVVPTPSGNVSVIAAVARVSRVRPSTGRVQERFVVKTRMRIGAIENEVEVSLVSRANMLVPMLVGRRALPKGVRVDPHRYYVHGRVSRSAKPPVARRVVRKNGA